MAQLSIAETIKDNLDDMTRSERQVATYYLGNTGDFAFSTLDRIAEAVDTSTTSVLRFCRRLGFSGFKDFQQSLREELRYQPRLPDKFQRSAMYDSEDNLLNHIITQDIHCIDETFRELSHEDIHQAVAAIGNARRVYTFGMKESYALAHYAYTRLLTVRPDVQVLQAGYNGEIESLLDMTQEDVCLVFLFYRYTWQTISVLELLKYRHIPVILVTNEPCDAIRHLAQQLLL